MNGAIMSVLSSVPSRLYNVITQAYFVILIIGWYYVMHALWNEDACCILNKRFRSGNHNMVDNLTETVF